MKTRYFIFLSFKGTYYHGWQLQSNSVTVQKSLDEALSKILAEDILTTGAGRTDAGVHALFFCAHFDSDRPDLDSNKNLIFKLNRFLPKDISISHLLKVRPDAHSRFSAISRTYRYNISMTKNPFTDESSWYIHGKIDIDYMNEACKILMNHGDFTSFTRLHSDTRSNLCKIYSASWEEVDNQLIFTIKADRFLRNMVRAIVGTMIEVGHDKLNLKGFEEIILAKDRCRAGKSAPAKGLFLISIEYPDEVFI